jgi:cell division initiation protein
MKISAIDIRKHTFEKIFRGYDPDEVDAFLNSLSQEWERYSSENSLLKMQLEYAEKELNKLKDIESTLFRTLKAAEDTSRLIEKEAIEAAEKRIEESKVTANDLVTEAENRTGQIIKETEDRLKRFKEDFAAEIKIQERDFKAIENFRDNLIVQLSSLANNTIETVERFDKKYDKESVLNKMDEIKQHVSEIEIPKKNYTPPVFREVPEPVEPKEEEVQAVFKDDKPEVAFEIVDSVEEEEAEIEEEIVEVEEVKPEPVAEIVFREPEVIPEPEYTEPEKKADKTAAEESAEALAEMHKSAEKARDNAAAGVNRFRTQENSQPKKPSGGGGSFFDQI